MNFCYTHKNLLFVGLLVCILIAVGLTYTQLNSKYADLKQQVSKFNLLAATSAQPSEKTKEKPRAAAFDARLSELQNQVTSLQHEVAWFRQQVNQLLEYQNTALTPSDSVSQSRLSPENETDHLTESHMQEQSSSLAEVTQVLRGQHDLEVRDDEWASSVEYAVFSAFNVLPELSNILVEDLDCRATLCRFVWKFAEGLSDEEYFILENDMMAALGAAGLPHSTQVGDGLRAEGYFFRETAQSTHQRKRD